MDASHAITSTLPKAVKAARAAYRRDRANAYALLEPWTLPPLGGDLPRLGLMPPAPYADSRIRVDFAGGRTVEGSDGLTVGPSDRWTITVLPFALSSRECDGCTCAPDTWGGLKLYVGALFHDRWYLSMAAIAEAWGWPVDKARKLGDIVFATILRDQARGLSGLSRVRGALAVRLYYAGVRAFGGIAHRLLVALALAAALSGCAGGCNAPAAWGGDTPADAPAHSFTNTLTGAHFESISQRGGGGGETSPSDQPQRPNSFPAAEADGPSEPPPPPPMTPEQEAE